MNRCAGYSSCTSIRRAAQKSEPKLQKCTKPQAVAAGVHLAPLSFDFNAGRNLFTALLTRMRSDDSFARLRIFLSPAPPIFAPVRPTNVWIFERHLAQVSSDGMTPQMFDGQATAIGVRPTHDRKTVGKAVSSLRLVR